MKSVATILFAAAALAVAGPSLAQPRDHDRYDHHDRYDRRHHDRYDGYRHRREELRYHRRHERVCEWRHHQRVCFWTWR